MANSTAEERPKKPYPDYPLTLHPSGRLCKKIRGTLHYFGRWGVVQNGKVTPADNLEQAFQEAADEYERQKIDLHAGRTPRPAPKDGLTVAKLVNQYLNAKLRLVESGELSRVTFSEYNRASAFVVESFGNTRAVSDLVADDFGKLRAELAKNRGPVALGGTIQKIRMIFKWGFDEGLIDVPIRFGQSFNKPSLKTLRKARASGGSKMFEADEIRLILSALAGGEVVTKRTDKKTGEPIKVTFEPRPDLHAATLLGINCGYGQSDVSRVPRDAFDLQAGFVSYHREKTGIERRAALWPETVEAVRKAIAERPEPKDRSDDELAFLGPNGRPWVGLASGDDPAKGDRTDTLGKSFSAILKRLGINGRRGFYALRHSHQTAAESCGDFPAVRLVMGHADQSMSAIYRERIEDTRLRKVADTVRDWLFGKGVAE